MQPNSWRLLMVDDDREDFILVRAMLRDNPNLQVQLDHAATAAEGRYLLQDNHYDALLVDYDLGLENGLAFIREMVQAGCRTPMLLVTGRGSYELDVSASEAGADDYLNKNELSPTILERAVRYAIERRRTAVALQLSEEKNRRLIEHSADGILLAGEDGCLLDWNASRAGMTGIPAEEALGRPVWELLAGGTAAEALRSMSAGGEPSLLRLEERLPHPQGLERQLQTLVFPVRTEDGFLIGAISRDMTELEAARQEVASLARIPAENPSPILRIDREGRLLYANPASQCLVEAFNLQIGHPVPAGWAQRVGRALTDGQMQDFELKAGLKVFEVTLRPVSAYGYANLYAIDMTERRASEAELRRERELLQAIFDRIPVMITLYRPELEMMQFNPECERLLGWTAEEAQQPGVDFMGEIYPDPEYRRMVEDYMASLREGWKDLVVTARDGSLIESSWSNLKLSDDTTVGIGIDLRERKAAERALRASQERFRRLFEDNSLPILLTGPEGEIFEANAAFLEMLGYSAEDVASGRLRWDALTPPEFSALDARHTAEAIERGVCTPYEKEFIHRDGTRVPIQIGYSYLPGERDELVGYALDLRQRRRAGETLRRYAEHFRLAQAAGRMATWEVDRRGGQHYIADNCYLMFGIDPMDTDLMDTWWNGVHPEDRALLQAKEAQCEAEGSASAEYRYTSPAEPEDERWIFTQAAMVTRSDGQRVMAEIHFDITEQKRTLEALRASEQQFRLMGESVDYGVWLCDAEGKVEYLSQSYLDLIDMTMDELQDYAWTCRMPPGEVEPMLDHWRTCMRTGADWDYEYHIHGPDERYHTVLSRGKPLRDEQGRITHWVGINLDITDRKRIESHSAFLAGLGDQLLGMKDEREVIGHMVESVRAHLQAGGCIMEEEDPTDSAYHHIHTHRGESGLVPKQFPLSSVPPAFIDALTRGKTVVVEDSSNDPRTAEYYERMFKPHGAEAVLIIPRNKDGRWTGSLTVNHPQPRRWLPDEIETASSAADLAWLAVDKVRTYQSLKTAEERLRVALTSVPVTVFTQDDQLRYTWAYTTAMDSGPYIGRSDGNMVPGIDDHEVVEFKRAALESGQSRQGEITLTHNGVPRHFIIAVEPLRDASGLVTGLTGSTMEITELRRLENQRSEQLSRLSVQAQLLLQRELERLEIARELHDGPLQELIAVSFSLEDAMQTDERELRLRKHRDIQQAVRNQVAEIRRFCNELRPPALAPFGLEKAIRSYVDDLRQRDPNLQIILDLMPDGKRLPEAVRLALYRIFQEQMNNIRRHSGASQVEVLLEVADDRVMLEMRDNGRGFNLPEDWLSFAQTGHLGLIGMRERAHGVGGQLSIHSQPRQGTQLQVAVPL